MRNRLTTLLPAMLLVLGGTCMDRSEADTLVSQARRLYLTGSYEEALHSMEKVEGSFDSPALQLGIGNCWYRLGDLPHAILHYERGLRLSPGDEDLRMNLDLALSQTKDRVPGEADHVVARGWASFRAGSDPDQWARRSLWLSATLFLLLLLARITGGTAGRRVLYGASALAALLLVMSVGFAFARDQQLKSHHQAILVAPKTDVRAEPRDQAKVLFLLHKGTKVELRDTTDGWGEVSIASGASGWLPLSSIERI